jgi:outer membrane protein assembly factor BamB
MLSSQLLIVGAKNSVSAFNRSTGQLVWTTQLKGGMVGGEFVTLHIDGLQVFAHARGELFCLELSTGRILWTNPLKGLGYGIATLATPGAAQHPTAAQAQVIAAQQAAAASSGGSASAV